MDLRKDIKQLKIAAAQNTRERDYWINRLAGEPVKSHFPYDCSREGTGEAKIGSVTFTFPGEVTAQLDEIGKGDLYNLNLLIITGIILLLNKYTGNSEVIIGMPIYKQDLQGEFINTVLPLRSRVEKGMTVKEFLLQTRQTIDDAVENQNYPIEILAEQITGLPSGDRGSFPLFETAVLLENIHEKKYIEEIRCNTVFSFNSQNGHIEGLVGYDSSLYRETTIRNIVSHLINLLQAAFSNVNSRLSAVEMLSEDERKRLLEDFNRTTAIYPKEQTLHHRFAQQVEKTPHRTAVSSPIDLSEIYNQLESETKNPHPGHEVEILCFKKSAYLYQTPLPANENTHLYLLKTRHHNSLVVNHHLVRMLDRFDGRGNLRALYAWIKGQEEEKEKHVEFLIYSIPAGDLLEISSEFHHPPGIYSLERVVERFEDFFQLVKSLYNHHLIELTGVRTEDSPGENPVENYFTGGAGPGLSPLGVGAAGNIVDLRKMTQNKSFSGKKQFFPRNPASLEKSREGAAGPARVLLLGDSPGTATTGLLYLGSYLERNGIKARCQFYDPARDYGSMKENIEELLQEIQPAVVAISMKWFLYIARVMDMTKIIKAYAGKQGHDIKVVVGGNTASYYAEDIIKNEGIDILVRGDGEEPLLRICRGEEIATIPNCLYKNKEGKIQENPFTYVQDETHSPGIYLSHLEEILLSHHAARLGTFFIVTQKGCAMNCLYCGGCRRAQQKTFNREHVYRRGVKEVRQDIMEAKPYASTFMFEFDIPDKNLRDYCRQIWEGIDLTGHYCIFSTLEPPAAALIELVSQTFNYVYWDFDICTPSERHRNRLYSLGLVKPQPTDEDILDFMDRGEKYQNLEVRLNIITGLPYFTPGDIEPGERLLSKIMTDYTCFGELHWARLHAQPGAPVTGDAGKYEMHSYATTFEDFLSHSKENFNPASVYTSVENFSYPYIYFNDDGLNSRVTNFYLEINKKVAQHTRDKKRGLIASKTLTYRQMDEKAGQLTGALRAKGVGPGGIVGLMLERSLEIPVGILGILKAGCAYMPIDPEFPMERVEYMLKDSKAAALVTTRDLPEENNKTIGWDGEKILLEPGNCPGRGEVPSPEAHGYCPGRGEVSSPEISGNLAYVIYTSGTTGKPKGVLLTHENLVNYVHWFTSAAGITQNDKTVLMSSFAFDLGYTSLYPSILNGGELHILPREIYLLGERLLDYIRQEGITYIKSTPSLFSVIVDSPNFSAKTCKSLRLAAIGGEAIHVKDIEKAHALCPFIRIMNHYGPTEATIGSVATIIDFDRFEIYKKNPVLGKPIYNTVVYVLGKDLNLLPVGVPGELCISGSGVGMGYLNQPELTAEKFIVPSATRNPFEKGFLDFPKLLFNYHSPLTIHHSPLYRTGDLARWLPDGTVEFLGRIDTQVKIRGYRVELKEIENKLRKHPRVEEVLAAVKEKVVPGGIAGPGKEEKYLCAYIVSKEIEGIPLPPAPREGKAEQQRKVICFQELGVEKYVIRRGEGDSQEIAVTSNGRSLTFGELERNSDRLAGLIREKYNDGNRLSRQERIRYKRQMLLAGWGQASQEKLKSTTVFVAGAGGGASPAVIQLALAGFGTIKICDFDSVELSNLNRQFLHDEERLGMNKALSAQITVNKTNPHVQVIPYTEKITRENVFDLVGDSAIIFDMLDDPADKFILSECAVVKQIPHVIISMTDINAYAAVLHTPYTPCYHCIFDKKKLEAIVTGMKQNVDHYSKNPLPVVATSLFISTGVVVNEALKILLGFEKPAYNKFFYFNQRGASGDLVFTPGYKAMTYLFSDHFLGLCKEQGFDWDVGWRGNFLEEFTIKPDPDCPVCGPRGVEKQKALEKQRKKAKANPGENRENQNLQTQQTIALLVNHGTDLAVGVVGAIKSAGVLVPLDTESTMEEWAGILEDSEARVIVTDDKWMSTAGKLRDRVNTNIAVINIGGIDDTETGGDRPGSMEIPLESRPDRPAYILYSPGPGNKFETRDRIMKGLYKALYTKHKYTFETNKKTPGTGPLIEELREYLRGELPDYMIPTHIIPIKKIPLTPNGKVDKKALPEPNLNARDDDNSPGNEVEEKLKAIWAEVLGIEKSTIGIDANFFSLGGHSLNATIMISKIQKEFDIKLPLGEIFKTPTIRQLAGKMEVAEIDRHVPVEPVEEKEYYPLSSAQKRIYVFQQLDTESTAYNMPLLLELGPGVEKQRLETAFKELIKRHESLGTSFEVLKGEPVQKVHRDVEFEIEGYEVNAGKETTNRSKKEMNRGLVEIQVRVKEEKQKQEIGKAAGHFFRFFDLSRAPLLRVGLIRISTPGPSTRGENPGDHYLLMIDMHHIIADGISVDIMQKEFLNLYAGQELKPLKLRYKDYSQWQNSREKSPIKIRQEKYWLKKLEGKISPLNFPTDFPRPEIQGFDGDFVVFGIGEEVTAVLKKMALERGMTMFMILLAGYTILLSKICRQEDIIIGVPVAGRRNADLEKIIGMFVNVLVMRNRPRAIQTVEEFLSETKENVLKAYENQDYQYDQLVQKIITGRYADRTALVETHFIMQNIGKIEDSAQAKPGNQKEPTGQEKENNPKEGILESYIMTKTRLEMALFAMEKGDTVELQWNYMTGLFKKDTIEKFCRYFVNILEIIAKTPTIPIDEIELITAEEKKRVISQSRQDKEIFDRLEEEDFNEIF